jgi:hypothetical protein
MADIKPIETVYNGYKFRSRLEARWAVFFDTAGIRYEYEREGFDLGTRAGRARWYLPDFWLPEHQLWVEIKPAGYGDDVIPWDYKPGTSEWAWDMCHDLARGTGFGCLYIEGHPWPGDYDLAHVFPTDTQGEDGVLEGEFGACVGCSGLWIAVHPVYRGFDNYPIGPHTCDEQHRNMAPQGTSPRLLDAYRAARRARFEHGAKG